jgi:uncharacterized phage-associated protein
MASALDAAQYILHRCGPMTTMKLQKLVYYSQVWAVVWDDDVLFNETIEAWDNGPVVRDLWSATRGKFRVESVPGGDLKNVTKKQRKTIKKVLSFYGHKDAQWLSDLTHMEKPWREAHAISNSMDISLETISEYYSTLEPNVEV